MLAALLLTASLVSQYRPSWLELGTRAVTGGADHDIVTIGQGSFHAIKFAVHGSVVHFHRVVLRFENGNKRELRLTEWVPAGGETRNIHLKKGERAIRSVEFWYDGSSVGRKGAVVQVLGGL